MGFSGKVRNWFGGARREWPGAAALLLLLFAAALTGCAPDPLSKTYTDLVDRQVDGNVFSTEPVRGALKPLRHEHAGYSYKCTECHTAIAAPRRQQANVPEHADIVLNHGLNTNCMNCHHPTERNDYVGYEGDVIPADQPARLCAKCHGPQFRDWERGVHGRQNGHWDASKGEKTKLYCIQCHDPHDPHFKPMQPSPPPVYNRFQPTAGVTAHE